MALTALMLGCGSGHATVNYGWSGHDRATNEDVTVNRGPMPTAETFAGVYHSEQIGDVQVEPKAQFRRFIRREPLGVVFTVPAWNYPYLTAVNSVVPALLAGNAVVIKHSTQTPLSWQRYAPVQSQSPVHGPPFAS